MKAEDLLKEIGEIEDAIICEADTYTLYEKRRFPRRKNWIIWGMALAASFLILVVYGAVSQEQYPKLPILKLPETQEEGFGYESYMAYEADELFSDNPWSESLAIKTLPVFNRQVEFDGAGLAMKGLSVERMQEKVRQTAASLGLERASININRDTNCVTAKSGDITIETTPDGVTSVFFEIGVKLPEEYKFIVNSKTKEQAKESIKYLVNEYSSLIHMESPALAVAAHYNIYGERNISYEAFEGKGNITENILNYNFDRVSFSLNEENNLWIIRRYEEDLTQKIGDYPIITAKDAKKLLLKGHYLTSVPYKISNKKNVAFVELVYRNSISDKVLMPYYKFFVEIPEEKLENGLKVFGNYYVPAIRREYLNVKKE